MKGFAMTDDLVNTAREDRPMTDKELTDEQLSHLPDLVVLALVGFALLKRNSEKSEWSHPAIAAFKPLVEEKLNARSKNKKDLWQLQYERNNSDDR